MSWADLLDEAVYVFVVSFGIVLFDAILRRSLVDYETKQELRTWLQKRELSRHDEIEQIQAQHTHERSLIRLEHQLLLERLAAEPIEGEET